MAKGKKKKNEEQLTTGRSFSIIEASVKDDFCNYTYEVIEGIGIGDKHKVEGSGIVKDGLLNAFSKFNAHMAVIDEVFKHSKIEIEDIGALHVHELSELYRVSGFKMKSTKGYETVKLTGTKYVSSAGGWMELKSPEITLDNLSSYKWYNELKTVCDNARLEVALYKEGNYTPVKKDEEEKDDKGQGNLFKQGEKNEVLENELASAEV